MLTLQAPATPVPPTPAPTVAERPIRSAAVRLADGRVFENVAHHDAARDAFEATGGVLGEDYACQDDHPFWAFYEQAVTHGFMTAAGIFLTREEALSVAVAGGQYGRRALPADGQLMSEDCDGIQ